MTGTYIPKEPDLCACNNAMAETRWHCSGCGRWKPSRQEFCSHCSPALPLDDLDAYFREEQAG